MISKKLSEFIEKAKLGDTYWVEKAKLDFALQLDKFIKFSNLSNKEFALKLGTSPAYISKIFRGESNLTIESMVKVARASNAELQINLIPNNNAKSIWINKIVELNLKHTHKVAHFQSSSTSAVNFAANEDLVEEPRYG